MDQKLAIKTREHGYEKLKGVLSALNNEQIAAKGVLGRWAVRDIVAHITAWNQRALKEIDSILSNKGGWVSLSKAEQRVFNDGEVAKRKGIKTASILKEWEKSSLDLIQRMKDLSEPEWVHRDTGHKKSNGSPLTVASIFDYKYGQDTHEGGHAKEIAGYFNLRDFVV